MSQFTHPFTKKFFVSTPLLLAACMLSALGCTVDSASARAPIPPGTKAAVANNGLTASPHEITASKTEPKKVRVEAIRSESYTHRLEISGKALARRESTLSLGVAGQVQQILVSRGDKVKKGQVLLKLERTGFILGVELADAAVAGAISQTELLKTETVRLNHLLAEDAAPTASLDQLNAQTRGADAQARIAQANLSKARKALRDSVLRAPFDGVISDILIEEGEQAPSVPATMLMKIVDASTLEVQLFIPEESSRFIHVGDTAAVTVESAGIVVDGAVIFVSDTITPGARTFEVRIAIDNRDGRIKAGAYARVRLEQPTNQSALFIPIATVQRDASDGPFIFVAEGNLASMRPITLGPMDGARVLVTSGLAKGDQLIISDTGGMVDGHPIQIENR